MDRLDSSGDDIASHPDLQNLRGAGAPSRRQARRQRKQLQRQWRDAGVQRQQRRRRWRSGLTVGAVIVLVVGVVAAAVYFNDADEGAGGNESVRRTPPSTTPTRYVPDAAVQLYQPFVGTPAASWRDGLAGIRTPKAKATGDFSRDDVAKVLSGVRKSLRAGFLDPKVVERHDLDVFRRTLTPSNRRQLTDKQLRGLVVQTHRDYPLLPASPKFDGTLTLRAGESGELVVRARFAAAYAFDTDTPDRLQGSLDIVSVVNTFIDFRYYDGPRWHPDDHGLQIREWEGYVFSVNCELARKGYLAPYYSERAVSAKDHGDPEQYFDATSKLDWANGCPE